MVCHLSKVPSKELVNVNWDVVVDIHNKMCIRERERERERGLTILTTLFGRLSSPFRNIQIHKSTSTRRKKEKQLFVISQKFLLKNL
jgi:hypothetical protein